MPDWNNAFVCAAAAVCILIFLTAYYFIRRSLMPDENFDSSILRSLTIEDKRDSLLYCVSFFKDAYDCEGMPGLADFMEFRIRAAIVFRFYKKLRNVSYVFVKLKSFYYKDKPLPDLTAKFRSRLTQDGRKGDITGAFCLYGYEEFSKLLEQIHI